jgi:hypothetical protein
VTNGPKSFIAITAFHPIITIATHNSSSDRLYCSANIFADFLADFLAHCRAFLRSNLRAYPTADMVAHSLAHLCAI